MNESKIKTLYKGKYVLVDLVDQTIELIIVPRGNNVYSYSESYELLRELKDAWLEITVNSPPRDCLGLHHDD